MPERKAAYEMKMEEWRDAVNVAARPGESKYWARAGS